mmetsp:Transcript_31695/g.68124  ORF Transcript_31695/g.68124 Transcript_31695/m.68124 type:complete len:246 (-) Transcript_31695:192-929(-)
MCTWLASGTRRSMRSTTSTASLRLVSNSRPASAAAQCLTRSCGSESRAEPAQACLSSCSKTMYFSPRMPTSSPLILSRRLSRRCRQTIATSCSTSVHTWPSGFPVAINVRRPPCSCERRSGCGRRTPTSCGRSPHSACSRACLSTRRSITTSLGTSSSARCEPSSASRSWRRRRRPTQTAMWSTRASRRTRRRQSAAAASAARRSASGVLEDSPWAGWKAWGPASLDEPSMEAIAHGLRRAGYFQ